MTAEQLVSCRSCDRQIEDCAFCETEGCAEAICYRCLTEELGERLTQPHTHGG
jgi:protein-arginine kinase activator protein McsA